MHQIKIRLREARGSRMASRTTLLVALIFPFFFPPNPPVYSQDEKFRLAAAAYLQQLQTVGAETLNSEYETEFFFLLEPREKERYENLPLPERRRYIAGYWRLSDPDPFTPANERLEEHLRRREFARENFKTAKPPYFDDRGQIYLKYGRPKVRYTDPGGAMHLNTELMIFLPQIDPSSTQRGGADSSSFERRVDPAWVFNTGKAIGSLLAPGSATVLENESWNYEHIASNLVFNFVREGSRFRLVTDLRKAVRGGRMRDRTLKTAALYLQRQHLSQVYFNLARDFEEIGHQMRDWPAEFQLNRLDNTVQLTLDRGIRTVKESLRNSPTAAYTYEVSEQSLPFVADIAQFRGEQNQTRVVIGFGVNLGENGADEDSNSVRLTSVTYSYVLSNLLGETLAGADQKKIIPTTASVLGSVGVMEVNCDPARYLLALQAAWIGGRHRSMSRLPLAVRDFRGSHLMISDIQFYLPISPPAETSFEVTAAKTVAYPFAAVLKSMPLIIHFEIYNLTAIGLEKNYRIDYSITEKKTGGNLLSKLAKPFVKKEEGSITLAERRTVTQPTAQESLTLSLEKLRPGSYQLEITVRAERDTAIVAKTSKQFVLAGEK